MKDLFTKNRLLSVVRIVFTFLAFCFLTLIDFLHFNMYANQRTDEIEIKTNVILVTFLTGLVLRLLKASKATFFLIVIADMILIFFSFEEIFADTIWKSLKNILLEPGVTAIILSIVLLTLDWTKRYNRLFRPSSSKQTVVGEL